MSVYGGDSWAREAQYRKRRVDDLIIEGVDASSYKRLSSGKFACLVCPNNTVLDTPTMLSAHVNGSRHQAADLRRKDRELSIQEEANKRIAMSDRVKYGSAYSASAKQTKTASKPLIERARKAATEVLSGEFGRTEEVKSEENSNVAPCGKFSAVNADLHKTEPKHEGVVGDVVSLDYRKRLEKELKFTAAGWKRDGYGKWFKDENAEFDSDEEDPNIVLTSIS